MLKPTFAGYVQLIYTLFEEFERQQMEVLFGFPSHYAQAD